MSNTGTLRGRDQETYLEVSLTGLTGLTLDSTQAVKKVLRFTGTLGADVTVRLSLNREFAGMSWTFENLTIGGFTVTVAPLGGTGVDVAPGINTGGWFDGTNLIGTGSVAAAGLSATIGDAVTSVPVILEDPQPGDTLIFIQVGDTITIVNGPAAAGGQVVITVDASVILNPTQSDASNIELRAGTIDEPFSVTFPDATDGKMWVVENQTGQPCTLVGDDGGEAFLVNNARCAVLWDGTTLTRMWLSTPTHFNYAGSDPITFSTWDQVDADYIEFTPVAGSVTINWPNGGSLGKRGRRQTIKNDHTSQWIDVRTNGAGSDKTTRLLPGETASFVIDDSGALVPDWTRAFERRVSVTHDNTATYTVLHPDFLAQVLVIDGTLSATRNLVLPTVNHHSWIVQNTTTQSLVVKTAAGTGVTLLAGKTQRVACDGTNLVPLALPVGGTEKFLQRSDGQIFLGLTTPSADTEAVVIGDHCRFKVGPLDLDDGVDIRTGSSTGTRYGTGSSAKQGFWGNTPRTRGSVSGATTEALLDNTLTLLASYGLIEPFTTPLSLSPWLFVDPRTFTGAHNDPVGTLTDSSGNSRSALAAGSLRGLLQVSSNLSPNGSRLVRLDGVDDSYDFTGAMFAVTSGVMITVAGNFSTNSGAGQVIFTDDTHQRPQCIVETFTTNLYAFRDENHTITFGGFSGGWQVLQWVFRPPSGGTGLAELWKNGAQLTPSGSPTWNWNPVSSAGFIISGGTLPAKVDLGPIIVTPGDVTDLTREGLRAWIGSHY